MADSIDYLCDLFQAFGPVTPRRMFGGYGLYHAGLMFALVADDQIYFKADAGNVADFEQAGLPPFEYDKAGRRMKMSYYQAPEEILDDPDIAAHWAHQAFAAAQRAREKKR